MGRKLNLRDVPGDYVDFEWVYDGEAGEWVVALVRNGKQLKSSRRASRVMVQGIWVVEEYVRQLRREYGTLWAAPVELLRLIGRMKVEKRTGGTLR